jgi:hypothetical protein
VKIRNGFVSNSSSSSYIVNIKVEPKVFYNLLQAEYGWHMFGKAEAMKDLKKEIKEHEKYSRSILQDERGEELAERLKKLQNTDSNNRNIIKIILENHNILIKENADEVELESSTSMHNDFNEGVDDVLKEIILFFLMDTEYKVVAHREADE